MIDNSNLIIIVGAMKSGTTSLFKILSQHPLIVPTNRKETHFFNKNYHKGISYYSNHWPDLNRSDCIYLESTPAYTQCDLHPNVPDRIYRHFPDAKIIYVVRDRLDRIESMFRQYVNDTRDTRSINDHLPEFIIETSNYYKQISRYMNFFDRNQILIVTTDSLESEPDRTLSSLCDWLGIENISFKNASVKYGNSRVTNTVLYQGLRKVAVFKHMSAILPQRIKYAIIERLTHTERIKKNQFSLSASKRLELLDYFEADMEQMKREFKIQI